jgi:penicillin-binding protein 2
LVIGTQDAVSRVKSIVQVSAPIDLKYKSENIATIHKAVGGVPTEGTSARAFAGATYRSGGKTGTAQAVSIGQKDKYDSRRIEEHLRDHALYMAFAPLESPQIALAIVVENAGFGAEHAAPIARRIFDYVVSGRYPNKEDIAAVQEAKAAAPLGKPRLVKDIPWPLEE